MRTFEIENTADVPSPSLLIDVDRVRRNIQRMLQWAGDRGPDVLRPHVKTHKLPQIVRMKMDAGINNSKPARLPKVR